MASVITHIPDSIRLTGYITEPMAASAKARLAAILSNRDLKCPLAPISQVSVQVNVWLNAVDDNRLSDLGAERSMSIGEVISALLVDGSNAHVQSTMDVKVKEIKCSTDLMRVLKATKKETRKEQVRFFDNLEVLTKIEDSSQLPRVLFAEAGTGIGKTLAYLALAHAFIKRNELAKVCVAVPTHALMDQVLSEWRSMTSALKEPVLTATLIGQHEFVSEQALLDLIPLVEDEQIATALMSWAGEGAPCAPDAVIRHKWTMAGLRYAVPLFTKSKEANLTLRDDDEDAGYFAYKEQWGAMHDASLIVVSHMMLANLVKRRLNAQAKDLKDSQGIKEATDKWKEAKKLKAQNLKDSPRVKETTADLDSLPTPEKERTLYSILNEIYADSDTDVGFDILPDLDLLIVDEAHNLEDAFSLVLSQDISLWSLEKQVRDLHFMFPKQITAATVRNMEHIRDTLQKSPSASADKSMVLLDEDKKTLVELDSVLGTITKLKDSARKKIVKTQGFKRIVQTARSIHLALIAGESYGGSMSARIDWSPDRKWPRLQVGRVSVGREMNYLWIAVAQRSILVSGTLYQEYPQLSCESARRTLSVPVKLMLTSEPIHAAWQYTPVTACVISSYTAADGREQFIRPMLPKLPTAAETKNYEVLYSGWVDDVAIYISDAHNVAVGGLLVLGTAYRDIEAIAAILKIRSKDTVMVQKKGVPLQTLRGAFLAETEKKKRPILLAVGAAWTGFDLHDPTNPNALTDLVILNAPFGAIIRSLARQTRISRKDGIFEIVAVMVVLVRQGLGRLVRSPETPPNRRIHWLDAKIHLTSCAGLFAPVKRFLTKYKVLAV